MTESAPAKSPAVGRPLLLRRWVHYGVYLGFWALLGLFNFSQSYIIHLYIHRPFRPISTLILGLADWYVWAALTPGIFWLARRFPLGQRGWPISLLPHLAANLASVLLITTIMVPLWHYFVPPEPTGPQTPAELFRFMFVRELVFYSWVYWTLVAVCHALDYYRKYRERELRASQLEARLAQAQLQVLKMQLHPHFLFNTLNAISALVRQDPDRAEQALARLGDLLRLTLEEIGSQEVALSRELEFIGAYLEIEQMRLGPRLAVRLWVDPEAQSALVPYLVLQPLVENAVRHGVARHTRSGRLEVRASRVGGRLRLQVEDDGPGLAGTRPGRPREGIGLANTRARLQQLYGASHHFELGRGPAGGLLVTIEIPFNSAVPEVAPSPGA